MTEIGKMVRVSAAEFQRNIGRYQDLALSRPVAVTRNGREGTILISEEEYRRLTMGVEDQLVRWVQTVPAETPRSEPIPAELPAHLLMQESRAVS